MRELTAVIGMHRSGTSMVAQLIHELGIPVVGDEAFLSRGNAHNEEGYWETPELVTMNDRLLAFLGGDWRHVPPMPSGWARSPWLLPYRSHAKRLMAAIPGDRRCWKDPRLTLTLSFWQTVLPGTQYVICVRNPLDVHRSLERRDHMDVAEAVDLWGLYTAAALRDTTGERRLLLPYADFFDPEKDPVDALCRFLDLQEPEAPVSTVHQDLRHHVHTSEDVARHPDVPRSVKALWEALDEAFQHPNQPAALAALDAVAASYRGGEAITRGDVWKRRWRWLGGTVKMMTGVR